MGEKPGKGNVDVKISMKDRPAKIDRKANKVIVFIEDDEIRSCASFGTMPLKGATCLLVQGVLQLLSGLAEEHKINPLIPLTIFATTLEETAEVFLETAGKATQTSAMFWEGRKEGREDTDG